MIRLLFPKEFHFVIGLLFGALLAGLLTRKLVTKSNNKVYKVKRDGERLLRDGKSDVILLGSGGSSGVPLHASCLRRRKNNTVNANDLIELKDFDRECRANFNFLKKNDLDDDDNVTCEVCNDAYVSAFLKEFRGPDPCCNHRGNPSLLIRAEGENFMIDCGKTFQNSLFKWFPYYGVETVKGVLFTHDHADAILGVDDLRQLQPCNADCTESAAEPMYLYANDRTAKTLEETFPYLFPDQLSSRHVTNVKLKKMEHNNPIHFNRSLTITPLHVDHGRAYPDCFAFLISIGKAEIWYFSDISGVSDSATIKALEDRVGTCDVLFLDCCMKSIETHPSHFTLAEAERFIRKYQPKQTYVIGLGHEFDGRKDNTWLVDGKYKAQFGYDGLRVEA